MASSLKQKTEIIKLKKQLNDLYKDTIDFIEENSYKLEIEKKQSFTLQLILKAKRITRSVFSYFRKNV